MTVVMLAGLASTLGHGVAHADERDECASAYERTQRARQRSELISAVDAARRCARSSCPAILREECTQWVDELRKKQPRFVLRVRDAEGCPREDARVDVAEVSERDANDFVVDPGRHEVLVHDPVSARTRSLSIELTAGERRDIDVDFGGADVQCRPRRFSSLTEGLGIGGVSLVVAGATLGIIGAAKRGGLDDCKPGCSDGRLDSVRPFFVAGDVLAGVGVLLLGAAAITHFVHVSNRRATAQGLFPSQF